MLIWLWSEVNPTNHERDYRKTLMIVQLHGGACMMMNPEKCTLHNNYSSCKGNLTSDQKLDPLSLRTQLPHA